VYEEVPVGTTEIVAAAKTELDQDDSITSNAPHKNFLGTDRRIVNSLTHVFMNNLIVGMLFVTIKVISAVLP
jgi:hypothetical protein